MENLPEQPKRRKPPMPQTDRPFRCCGLTWEQMCKHYGGSIWTYKAIKRKYGLYGLRKELKRLEQYYAELLRKQEEKERENNG